MNSGNNRVTSQSVIVGTLVVAAASVFILHRRRRQMQPDKDGSNDRKHSNTTKQSTSSAKVQESNFYEQLGISEENLPTHTQREIYKERQRKAKIELISMKSPMYDNIYMLDQHREPMCTISMKKAKWYVKKGIGEWSTFKNDGDNNATNTDGTNGEMKCIRLLFGHNGANSDKSSSETLYLRSEKQNICVKCGDDGHHIRHYIVPYSYRALLPDQYKSHMSHDIVILCPDCHVDCERHSKRRMKRMEKELRMQLGPEYNEPPVIEDPNLGHIRSCALALVKWRQNIPTEKVEQYEEEVREYLASVCKTEQEKDAILNANNELSKSQLQKACGVNYRVKNPNYVPGSEIVVQSLKDATSIERFILDWRKHFIDTVSPQKMPAGWKVHNPVVCGGRKIGDCDAVKSW